MNTRILKKIRKRYSWTFKKHRYMPTTSYFVFDKKTRKTEEFWGYPTFIFCALIELYSIRMAYKYNDREYKQKPERLK